MAVWQCHKKAVRCDTNCEETSRMKVLSAPLVLVAAGLLASLMPCSASADDPLQRGTWLVSLEAFYSYEIRYSSTCAFIQYLARRWLYSVQHVRLAASQAYASIISLSPPLCLLQEGTSGTLPCFGNARTTPIPTQSRSPSRVPGVETTRQRISQRVREIMALHKH